MRVLFLADMLGALERRETIASLQYRDFLPLAIALAETPHGPLLGPTLLCTIARNAGFEAELFQMAFRKHRRDALLEKLRKNPEIVCITSTFILDEDTLRKGVEFVRKHAPQATVILGGPSLLSSPEMRALGDYCLLGEAEGTLVPLLEAIRDRRLDRGIPGLCYRDTSGNEVRNPPAREARLDSLPLPDWSLARRRPNEFYLIATQRGCAWRCAFCNYPALEGYQLRFRSTESVIAEMRANFERYGIHRYMFADSTFTAPPDRCRQLLEAIARLPFRIEWAAFGRVDTIGPELRDAMVASGCVALYLGIESGDQAILDRMKKRFTLNQARDAVGLLRNSGIRATASWIIGWPGETPDSVRRTVDFATELACEQNNVNTFTLTDLSPAELRPGKFGIEARDESWKHSTMSYQQASRWTRWAILKLASRGVTIGSLFDFFWLASLELGLSEISDLFRKAQMLSVASRNLRNHPMKNPPDEKLLRDELLRRCAQLRKSAHSHPIYGR
ncbi:MAG: B12-binding domain-containing radical SAM protein [Oligoflexia bacterium]|nr:B12-binding domain-containing radical SAM protein [Oligoflexia bacterium]